MPVRNARTPSGLARRPQWVRWFGVDAPGRPRQSSEAERRGAGRPWKPSAAQQVIDRADQAGDRAESRTEVALVGRAGMVVATAVRVVVPSAWSCAAASCCWCRGPSTPQPVVVACLATELRPARRDPGPEHCMAAASAPRTGSSTASSSRSQMRKDFTAVRLARAGKFNCSELSRSARPESTMNVTPGGRSSVLRDEKSLDPDTMGRLIVPSLTRTTGRNGHLPKSAT